MRWFFLFFLTSGFCSLVYQVVWLRLAMAQFGVTTPLVSMVLATFMGGLGLGCWGVGRLTDRFKGSSPAAPLRAYALTELLIGLSAVVVPIHLAWGHSILLQLGGGETIGAATHYAFSGLWLASALLPWCACMGATIPLAMSAIDAGLGGSKHSFSYLYLANVLGAILGTLVPAFVLIEIFGFRGTSLLAATLNGMLAITAFWLSTRPGLGDSKPPMAQAASEGGPRAIPAPNSTLLLLFTTGLVSLGMEVVWIRQFTPYLGTVVYAFATILAAYLFATWLGSRAYRAWVERRSPETSGPLWMWLAPLALMSALAADPRLPLGDGVSVVTFFRVFLGIGGFSAAAGFLTPMLVDRWSQGDSKRAGDAYAVNVLGSVIGPLIAGFGLLPWLREETALLVLAAPLVLIAIVVLIRPRRLGLAPVRHGRATFAGVVLVSAAIPLVSSDFEGIFEERVVRRDATAMVLATGEGMERRLLVNGQGVTLLTPATKMMVHLPLAFLPHKPTSGLVVAFGMGTSFRSMLSWGIESTAVELVPSVVELFDYYHEDASTLMKSPNAVVVVDDGRRFLERSEKLFDVVIVDPPPPLGAAGTSLLYSKEFFALVRRRLSRGGILQQWLYSPTGDDVVRASVAKALVESFPHVRAFRAFEGNGYHLLASEQPIQDRDAVALGARLPPEAAADLLEWGPYDSVEHTFRAMLEAEVSIQELIDGAPDARPLEDNWAVNEYYWLRHRLEELGLR